MVLLIHKKSRKYKFKGVAIMSREKLISELKKLNADEKIMVYTTNLSGSENATIYVVKHVLAGLTNPGLTDIAFKSIKMRI
jgi:hypothetical protein